MNELLEWYLAIAIIQFVMVVCASTYDYLKYDIEIKLDNLPVLFMLIIIPFLGFISIGRYVLEEIDHA